MEPSPSMSASWGWAITYFHSAELGENVPSGPKFRILLHAIKSKPSALTSTKASHSSSLIFSPKFIMTWRNSILLMNPFPSWKHFILLDDHNETYPVKDLERLSDLVLGLLVAQLLGHHVEEGGKGDHSSSVFVQFIDHILQIRRITTWETWVNFYGVLQSFIWNMSKKRPRSPIKLRNFSLVSK